MGRKGKRKAESKSDVEEEPIHPSIHAFDTTSFVSQPPDSSVDLESRLNGYADYIDRKLSMIPPKYYWAGKADPLTYEKMVDRKRKKQLGIAVEPTKKEKKKLKNKKEDAAAIVKKKLKHEQNDLKKFSLDRRTVPDLIEEGRVGKYEDDVDQEDVMIANVMDYSVAENNVDAQEGENEGKRKKSKAEKKAERYKEKVLSSKGGDLEEAELRTLAGAIDAQEQQEQQEAAAPPPPPPRTIVSKHMKEISEKLGFVPGSRVSSPAELKQRMALLRDWYKGRRSNEVVSQADGEEKKKIRMEKKLQRQELRKNKSLKKKAASSASATSAAAAAAESSAAGKNGENGGVVAQSPEAKKEDVNLDFGKFKFAGASTMPMYLEGRKRARDVELLKKAEAEKKQADELRKTEEGKKELAEKQWDKLIAKAEGEKIKDDPALLRKSLKKKEKKKAKSQAEWSEKQQKLDESLKNKQVDYLKRQEKNILRKKFGRKGSQAPRKKGRAGFEGKKK